jgi:hypothetical protein
MTIYESLIIYLSLGAPVAVYYFQRQAQSPDAHNVAKIILAFIFWPATFIQLIVDDGPHVRTPHAPDVIREGSNDRQLQTIFDLCKRDFGPIGRGYETAQFREMLERYTGLLSAVNFESVEEEKVMEFYVAAGHPNARLATACHVRHAGEKLRRHSRAASAEVRDFFSQVQMSADLRSAVASLAEKLGDLDTVRSLCGNTSRHSPTESAAATVELGREHREPARAA